MLIRFSNENIIANFFLRFNSKMGRIIRKYEGKRAAGSKKLNDIFHGISTKLDDVLLQLKGIRNDVHQKDLMEILCQKMKKLSLSD